MKKKTYPEFWIPDSETHNNLQKLKRFVDFVANVESASDEDKSKAEEIKELIEKMDKQDTYRKEWCVNLNIFDTEKQYKGETGPYWRQWSVYLESGYLQVETTLFSTKEDGYQSQEYFYHGMIYFEKDIKCERVYMDENFDIFTNDAINYQSYLTATMNDIEVDIDIWDR